MNINTFDFDADAHASVLTNPHSEVHAFAHASYLAHAPAHTTALEAFKFGQRPFQNVVCEGLEEGVRGMKVGGKRRLVVNQELAPPGVKLPPGVPIIYTVELTEVLNSYL